MGWPTVIGALAEALSGPPARRAEASVESRATLDNPPQWMLDAFGVTPSSSGESVTDQTALRVAAVWACIRVRAETMGSLPLNVYRRDKNDPRKKTIARDLPLYDILHNVSYSKYNLSAGIWRETINAWADLNGNGYSLIHRDVRGRVIGLQPWQPSQMKVGLDAQGFIDYTLVTQQGDMPWPASDMIHLKPLPYGRSQLVGISPIKFAQESIGGAIATDKFANKFYSNNARPGGVIEHPDKLSKDARDNLREDWTSKFQGSENAHKLAILQEGMKYHALSVNQDEAQFLETRRFGVEDVARIFNVPLHLIQELTHATFSNIEEQNISWVTNTVRSMAVRWEQELNRALLTDEERKEFFIAFVLDGLLRGNTKDRYDAYAVGRTNGWLSANDVRDKENMDPIEGGDIYMVPLNMQSAEGMLLHEALENPDSKNDGDAKTRALALALHAPAEKRVKNFDTRLRLRTRNAFAGLMKSSMNRLVRAEVREIRAAVKRMLIRSDATFQAWLDEYYNDLFPATSLRIMGPIFEAYALQMQKIAADEVGSDPTDEELQQMRTDYFEVFNLRHGGSSQGQIEQLMRDEPEPIDAIEERLDEWTETRGDYEGENETVRLGEAITLAVFVLAGIVTYRWQINPGACPLCTSINGKVVGVDKFFVPAGNIVDPQDGVTAPFTSKGDIGHPPLHRGCVCTVVPG